MNSLKPFTKRLKRWQSIDMSWFLPKILKTKHPLTFSWQQAPISTNLYQLFLPKGQNHDFYLPISANLRQSLPVLAPLCQWG